MSPATKPRTRKRLNLRSCVSLSAEMKKSPVYYQVCHLEARNARSAVGSTRGAAPAINVLSPPSAFTPAELTPMKSGMSRCRNRVVLKDSMSRIEFRRGIMLTQKKEVTSRMQKVNHERENKAIVQRYI